MSILRVEDQRADPSQTSQVIIIQTCITRKGLRFRLGFAIIMLTIFMLILNAHVKFATKWKTNLPSSHRAAFRSPRPSLFFGALLAPSTTPKAPKLTRGQLHRIAATTGSSYVIFWERNINTKNTTPVITAEFATERHTRSLKAKGINTTFASESERFLSVQGEDNAVSSVLNSSSPIMFMDMASSDMARRDLARLYGLRQVRRWRSPPPCTGQC